MTDPSVRKFYNIWRCKEIDGPETLNRLEPLGWTIVSVTGMAVHQRTLDEYAFYLMIVAWRPILPSEPRATPGGFVTP